MCERFEFTIQWGYGITKISVLKITVVIEDKRVKKCFANLFSNCAWYQVGNGTTKKQYITLLMNKTGISIFSPDYQESKFVNKMIKNLLLTLKTQKEFLIQSHTVYITPVKV